MPRPDRFNVKNNNVHGMSTRDIEATFADVLSGTGVSKSVVSRVTQCLSDDFEVFRKRDLSSEELLYLELDGTFLRYHQGAEKKEPILVATGYRIDGTRVLLHIGVGNGESYANWKGFLQEMVARGLREPLLIVTDGNPGVLKAIEEVFPQSLKQRCQKHRLENILGKAPKEIHDELKAEILESFHAKSYEQGLKKGREVITRYRQRFPSAMNGMEETLEACLQVLRLPEAHHKNGLSHTLDQGRYHRHKVGKGGSTALSATASAVPRWSGFAAIGTTWEREHMCKTCQLFVSSGVQLS